VFAAGVGYEGVKHGILKPPASSKASIAHTKKAPPATQSAVRTSVVAPALEAAHDQKPFRPVSVRARTHRPAHAGRTAVEHPGRALGLAKVDDSPLPPSHGTGKPAVKPKTTKPVKTVKAKKPANPNKPVKAHKPKKTKPTAVDTSTSTSHGKGPGDQGKPVKPVNPPPPPAPDEASAPGNGKSGH
jgi:hypothetical protein